LLAAGFDDCEQLNFLVFRAPRVFQAPHPPWRRVFRTPPAREMPLASGCPPLEVREPSEPARRRHIRRRNAPGLSIAVPAGCLQSLAPIVNHLMATAIANAEHGIFRTLSEKDSF
jgi:hypothetical protein